MTATVTTWHRVRVRRLNSTWRFWLAWCEADGCTWTSHAFGPGVWQSAVGKALTHVDETKEET